MHRAPAPPDLNVDTPAPTPDPPSLHVVTLAFGLNFFMLAYVPPPLPSCCHPVPWPFFFCLIGRSLDISYIAFGRAGVELPKRDITFNPWL